MEYLHEWAQRIDGAIALLLRLRDGGVVLEKVLGKESKVYSDALYNALTDKRNMQCFLQGDTIYYRNHQRDKKGKLIKCEAYFK